MSRPDGAPPVPTRTASPRRTGDPCRASWASSIALSEGETVAISVEEGLKRPAGSIERMIEVKVSFDTDPDRAKADTRHGAALALTPEEKMSVEDPIEMERLSEALPLERAASRWIVSADPEEQLAQIRPYVELGFTHLVFHAPGPDQNHFLKPYAERVLPLLRSKFG
jgi:coenzyme F420-dependent glucose-6-phosphate dehydrogenase